MTPWCPLCGGPLFRAVCYGLCRAQQPQRMKPQAQRQALAEIADGVPRAYYLVWEPLFQTEAGMPLDVARWASYRITPNGHRIRVWPTPVHRRAA